MATTRLDKEKPLLLTNSYKNPVPTTVGQMLLLLFWVRWMKPTNFYLKLNLKFSVLGHRQNR